MNIFRLIGDMSHLFAIIFLLYNICRKRSCAGISGKAQLLYLLVFLTRYLDVFYYFVSYYNTGLKFLFTFCTGLTVFLIFFKFRSTYDSKNDSFQIALLLLPAAGLAMYINHEFTFLEVMWTFSIYLEAVALLPQFYMIRKTGNMDMFTYHYLYTLFLYRACYIFNWYCRYRNEGYFDSIALYSGCVQTALYCYLLYTKHFLQKQAQAYFRLHNPGTCAAENVDKKMLALTLGAEPGETPSPSAVQPAGVTVVPNMEADPEQSTEQLNPESPADVVTQASEGINPGTSNHLPADADHLTDVGGYTPRAFPQPHQSVV